MFQEKKEMMYSNVLIVQRSSSRINDCFLIFSQYPTKFGTQLVMGANNVDTHGQAHGTLSFGPFKKEMMRW